jgi:hypothetical protein
MLQRHRLKPAFWSRTRKLCLSSGVHCSQLPYNQFIPLDGTRHENPSSYFGCLFYLSAVMYMDDTNLLHWPESSATDAKELKERVQWATMDYGCLAQATGGILKEKKCSLYFLD